MGMSLKAIEQYQKSFEECDCDEKISIKPILAIYMILKLILLCPSLFYFSPGNNLYVQEMVNS